jgi:outer membrane lipoprotein SlyB
LRAWGICLALALSLTACQRDISPDSYAVGSVGQVNQAVRGTVINARPVNISGSQSGLGAGAGAVGGAVAGSALGGSGSPRSNVIGAIGGAVVGGIAGSITEEALTQQNGIEYVIQAENGALLTIVQGPQPAFSVKQKVIVIYGTRARIIADPNPS